MFPTIPTGDSTKKPPSSKLDDQMTTLRVMSWRTNNRLLEIGGHWWCVDEERSKQVDGIYPLYSDSLYPCCNQPITSLTTIGPLLSKPTGRSEDPHWYLSCCICFFVMILTTPYAHESIFYFRFSLSQSPLIALSFCNHDDSVYCQPHSGSAAYTFFIVIYF